MTLVSEAHTDDVPAGHMVFAVLDDSGDAKTIWDKNKPDEVAAAKEMFTSLTKKGYRAYSVKKDGERNELVREFDPNAEKLIFHKPLVGG